MSETPAALSVAEPGPTPGLRHHVRVRPARRLRPEALVAALLLAAALALPFYVDGSWLRMGLFAFAAAVAALGLSLLMGQAGQLSLGHSFFVAAGPAGPCARCATATSWPASSAYR